ncbi:hypothetical protein GPA19_15910 [Azoarcus indigens]|uniref:hypothetical protein n=1 Tax=Azoarcus indigens TaxID=29545 RepID=UPI00105E053D|nr:hypothetical protein [Azoarcus indigens]NMG66430.1 hypothetical protein [Azoarcus indigens]
MSNTGKRQRHAGTLPPAHGLLEGVGEVFLLLALEDLVVRPQQGTRGDPGMHPGALKSSLGHCRKVFGKDSSQVLRLPERSAERHGAAA